MRINRELLRAKPKGGSLPEEIRERINLSTTETRTESPILLTFSTRSTVMLWLILLVSIVWVAVVTVPEVPKSVAAPVILIPGSGIVSVVGEAGTGVVEKVLVHPGQKVKRNETLLVLRRTQFIPELDIKQSATEAERGVATQSRKEAAAHENALALELKGYEAAYTALEKERQSYELKMGVLDARLNIASAAVERQRHLAEEGYASKNSVSDLESSRLALEAQKLDLNQQAASMVDKLTQARLTIAKAKEALVQAQSAGSKAAIQDGQRLLEKMADEERIIKAPFSGEVGAVLTSPGRAVREGEALLHLTSNTETPVFEAYVQPQQIAGIAKDQPASIELDAYPSRRFGRISATVVSVDSVPSILTELPDAKFLVQKGNATGSVYRVTLRMTKTPDSAEVRLLSGLQGVAHIKGQKKTIFAWLTEKR